MFQEFSKTVEARWATMSQSELFRTDITGNALWAAYLSFFPKGMDPIFRERTEHDCSCCKNFIRQVGGVVAIVNGQMVTIWGSSNLPAPYDTVASKMDALVRAANITGVFRTKERKYGMQKNVENIQGHLHTWHHFHVNIGTKHYHNKPDENASEFNTTAQVLKRGLTELHESAFDDVLSLIQENSLYRGAEFKASILGFRKLKRKFAQELNPDLFVWENLHNPAARFKNTVIGTLISDLSEGIDLESAVRSFETKVAPTNYKRPTALITEEMIQQAITTINDLGIEHSLDRRHATIADISINDVIWADSDDSKLMRSDLHNALLSAAKKPVTKEIPGSESMTMAHFIEDILPDATSMEILFENRMQSNLMSLIAPIHSDAPNILKWSNNFSWSYKGDVTDSIKERVKAAGGNINAKLRVSLAWFNYDDLDLHAYCPDGHVYFSSKSGDQRYGYHNNSNILDVDMNAGGGTTREPVENLAWVNPKDGHYRIMVHQYRKRESSNIGFNIQFEHDGNLSQYSYNRAVSGSIEVMEFDLVKGAIKNFKLGDKTLTGQGISQQVWGIPTESYVKVRTMMYSPNHWEGIEPVGNKHYLFILDGCANDEPTRGIYNEFLQNKFDKHRKVFEVLGNKTKCAVSRDQLSGLGFSSTNSASITIRVTNKQSTRTYKVII